MITIRGAVASFLISFCALANSTVIDYSVDSLGGNSYQYTYTVTNDTLAADIDEFTVYFDLGLYENIVSGAAPIDWDPLAIDPDAGLPDDGFYDALALVSGITAGDSLGGFVVSFDWLGAGTPGDQDFEIYDIGFNLLDIGTTTLAGIVEPPPTGVPEPETIVMLGLGLTVLLRTRRIKG